MAAAAVPENLKSLCSGHIFDLYSPAAHLPGGFSKSSIFLFYRPGANNAVGKIYVAGASGDLASLTAIATTMTEDQLVSARLPTVDAARLSAVTLDKATAELKAAGDSVSADTCFQFGTPEMSLSLSADSKQTRDHWTAGLLFLMSEAQKVVTAPLSPTSAANAAAAAASRRFSFDTKDVKAAETLPVLSSETMNRLANNDKQLLSIPALDFVSMMLVGRNFGFYADVGGKATRFPVFLFYKYEQDTPGFLYWCNPGTRAESAQTCLPLAKIDRLYVGKQVAVFTPEAKEDCCFTLLTPEAMVNLEAGSASQASAWLYAIDAALRGYNQRRFHHTEADPKAQRYYVDGVTAPNKYLPLDSVVIGGSIGASEVAAHASDAAKPVDAKAVQAEIAAERTAAAVAMSQSPAPAVLAAASHASASDKPQAHAQYAGTGPNPDTYQMVIALKAGNNFVSHTPTGTDTISVHYTPDETKAGSLTYVSLAHPNEAPKKIPLQNISDMYVGKEAAVWQLPAAAKADQLACLAITYRISADASAVLYLEGRNSSIIDFWVHGIHAVIQHALHKAVAVHEHTHHEHTKSDRPAGLNALNVSDVKLDLSALEGEVGSVSPRAKLPIGSESDLSLPTDVLVRMISKGRTFTRWTAGSASASVTVTYKKDETKSGSFYFSDSSARFALHAITDITLGKQSADFKDAAGSPDEQCVTFAAGADSSLSLEAESKDVVAGWLSAFNAIMHLSGKEVVSNDSEYESAPVPLEDVKTAPSSRSFSVKFGAENLLATAPASLSEADHVALLSLGVRFTKYEKEGESIFVTYARDATRSGSLYWCALGENPRERSIERALPIHTIADIYFGKQTVQFTSFAASREPDELCVSIVTRDNRSLNLAAASAEQLSSFLLALQTVFAQSGKKVVIGDEKSARSKHARRFTIQAVGRGSLADRAAQLALNKAGRSRKESVLSVPIEDMNDYKQPSPVELDSGLSAGILFRRLDAASGAVTPNVLFYFAKDETKQGSLYWSDDGTRPAALNNANRAPLDTLKDVVLGSAGNQTMTTAGFDDKRSATLVFAGANIHIESTTPEALSNFLLGVHAALTSTGSTVVTEDVGRVRKFSVLSSDSADAKSVVTAAPDTKAIEAGVEVTAFTTRGGVAKQSKVRVFYGNASQGFGRVYWSVPSASGDAAQSEVYSVSVGDITEFSIGKSKNKALGDSAFSDDASFTIVTPTKSLSVGTDSKATVTQWQSTIQAIINAQSSIVTAAGNNIEDSNHSLSIFGGTPSSPAAKDALQLIHVGHDFKAYKIKAGKVGHIAMFLFYEPAQAGAPADPSGGISFGELYWSAPGTRAPKPKHHIKLSTVTDLFIGRHADMEVFKNADTSDDRVFTIVGTEQTLSIEAATADVAQHWIHALTYILQRHGRDLLVQDEEGKTLAPNAAPARRRVSFLPFEVSAPGPAPNVGSAEIGRLFAAGRGTEVMSGQVASDIVAMMKYGRKFTAFLENHARTLLLFFAPSPVEHREGPGRLYWSHPSHRAESPLNSLLLTAIQDYSLGKNAKAFHISEGKGADEKCCFSLTTKYGVFCFEAASPAMRDTWIAGINFLLVSAGNKKLQLVDRSAPAVAGDEKGAGAVAASADPSNIRYCFIDDVNLDALAASTFDLARQMVRDPSALSGHNDAALRLMREGHEFFAFFFAKDRTLVRHKIFVFFKPSIDVNDGTFGLGTLLWNETHSYAENNVRRLSVHDITDIYVGKQSSPFRHENAKDVPDTTCFSLVSATKTLNLQAASATILNVWLVGLNALMNGGKKDVSLRENDRNAAAAAAAAQASAQAGSWLGGGAPKPEASIVAKLRHMATHYTPTHNQQVLEFLSAGSNFVKFTPPSDAVAGSAPKQVVKVFYAPPAQAGAPLSDGTLYWTEMDAKTQNASRALPVSQLREVHLLKVSAGFRIPEAADAPENRCLTLKSASGASWYLCAATTDELNVWLYGLIHIVTKNEQSIQLIEEGGAGAAAAQPVLDQRVVDTAKAAAVFEMMHRGSKFFQYEDGARAGEIRKKQVFVYVEADKANPRQAGALIWRSAGGVGRLELSDITDIYVGKRHKIFVSLRSLENSRCMTIVTATQILNLEADSKKQIISWVYGLYCAMQVVGRTILGRSVSQAEVAAVGAAQMSAAGLAPQPLRNAQLAAAGLDPARSLLAELENESSVEHTVRTLAGAAQARTAATEFAVRALARGRVFTAYSSVGHPRRESIYVSYEPSSRLNGAGSLKWNAGDAPSSNASAVHTLPLDKVSDIHLGKQNSAFRTPEASEADPERCLSILSDDLRVALHLEADSTESAKTFLIAINTAIAVGGRDVVLLGAGKAGAAADRRFAVMARASQPRGAAGAPSSTGLTAPLLADTVAVLAKGAAFTAHSAHAPQSSSVFVFYKPDAYSSRAGALYWCEVGKRSESVERRLSIESITNITLGKSAAAFQTAAAATVKDDVCLSIFAGHRALHVAATNADVVQCWFVAINGLLASIGRSVNDDGDSGRKFVVVADPEAANAVAAAGAGAAAGGAPIIGESEDDYGMELDAASLNTIADVVVWEGYLKARSGSDSKSVSPLFFRADTQSLSYFGAPNESKPLGSVPLSAVLRVRARGAELSVLISGKSDDRVLRLHASDAGTAGVLAGSLNELIRHQRAPSRLDLADVNTSVLLFANADAKEDAAPADDSKFPAAAEASTTVAVTVNNVSLTSAVAANTALTFRVSVAGVSATSRTITTDEDGLVARQRINFAETVTLAVPLLDAASKPRNLLLDVTVSAGAVVLGHWTNGQSEEVADWNLLPHPQVVSSFWQSLGAGAGGFKSEAPLLSFDAAVGSVGSIAIAAAITKAGAAAAGGADEKYPVAAAAADDSDEIVLALSPEETMQMLADRPAGTLTADERADAVRVVTAGQTFTRYSADASSSVVSKEEIFLFYNASAGVNGSFFWCAAGQRVQSYKKRLPLSAITSVVLGKDEAALKSASGDRTVTLTSPKFSLSVEAKTPHQLTAFLCAVHAIKSASGKRVIAS